MQYGRCSTVQSRTVLEFARCLSWTGVCVPCPYPCPCTASVPCPASVSSSAATVKSGGRYSTRWSHACHLAGVVRGPHCAPYAAAMLWCLRCAATKHASQPDWWSKGWSRRAGQSVGVVTALHCTCICTCICICVCTCTCAVAVIDHCATCTAVLMAVLGQPGCPQPHFSPRPASRLVLVSIGPTVQYCTVMRCIALQFTTVHPTLYWVLTGQVL